MWSSKLLQAIFIGIAFLFVNLTDAQALKYEFDPNWPELLLPDKWWRQWDMGLDVDEQDMIWVLTLPDAIGDHQNYARLDPATGDRCIAPPAVVVINSAGRVVNSWNTNRSLWSRLHGLAVDDRGYVWIGSLTVHKSTRESEQIGTIERGSEEDAPEAGDPAETEAVFEQIEDIKVDEGAREVYYVNNYLNGRVMVQDSEILEFKRGLGSFRKATERDQHGCTFTIE